jgi:general secretion pathway protein F
VPLFQYKAVSSSGEVQEGVLDGPTQGAVIERLQGMGLIPIRTSEAVGAVSAQAGAAKKSPFSLFASRRVTQDNVAVFTREIATLLKAGLPLDRSMEILLNLSENDRVKELLSGIRNEVRGGASLSKALDQHRDIFSRFYINMVRAGEVGGAQADVLRRLADYMERAKELRESIVSALIYPGILVAVAVLSIAVLMIFVVPQFKQIFDQAGQALPMATRIVLWAGEFLRGYWFLLIAALILAAFWMAKSLANPISRYRWDERFLRMPLFGDLVAKVEMARFSRTLATLMHNGVPLLTGLSIVRETMGNLIMAEAVGRVASELKEGRGLGRPMLETQRFPKLAVQMISVGEETGQLDAMLMQVADAYDMEVRMTVKRILSLIEPAMIIGMALVIGGIIMSILVAMLGLFALPF